MLIKVHVYPGAKEESITETSEARFNIYTKAKAERGEANRRVLYLLSKQFPNRRIRLVSGFRSSNKIISIDT